MRRVVGLLSSAKEHTQFASLKVQHTQDMLQVRNQGSSQQEAGLSYDQLELQEAAYFASVPGLGGAEAPCLLGLPALSQELLKIQEEILRKHMPHFICQVQTFTLRYLWVIICASPLVLQTCCPHLALRQSLLRPDAY